MNIRVLFFGAFSEHIEQNPLELSGITSVAQLKKQLETSYPILQKMPYALALNQQLIRSNESPIQAGDEVAIMPPFAGG